MCVADSFSSLYHVQTLMLTPPNILRTMQHVSSGPIRFRTEPGLTYDFLSNSFWGALASLRWRLCGTGPLSSMVYSSTAFVKSTDLRYVYPLTPPSLVRHAVVLTIRPTFTTRLAGSPTTRKGVPAFLSKTIPRAPMRLTWSSFGRRIQCLLMDLRCPTPA